MKVNLSGYRWQSWNRWAVPLTVAACAVTVSAVIPAPPARSANPSDDDIVQDQVIVRMQPGESEREFDQDHDEGEFVEQLGPSPIFRMQLRPGVTAAQFVSTATADQRAQYVDFMTRIRMAERARQYTSVFDGGDDATGYENSSALRQIGYQRAPQLTRGKGVIVAVLDTGISPTPLALRGKLVPGWNMVDGNRFTNDAPNRVDDNRNGFVDEATGHGTMVAGLIARMAPDAKLMPVKVLNSDGVGDLWTLAEGIRWAVAHGATVINASLGVGISSGLLTDLLDELETQDIVLVCSAGNDSTFRPQYPAAISKCVTVAAVDGVNRRAPFSNWGSWIDVDAPGVGIKSTNWNGRYAIWSGTSFAAPFVTGQATLMRAAAPKLEAGKVASLIRGTARSIDLFNPLFKGKLGAGMITVDAGIDAARVEGAND